MSRLTFRSALVALLTTMGAVASPASAATWRIEQPAPPTPPAGASAPPFGVPLGLVDDIKFWGPSGGVMAVHGNDVVAEGLYRFDGRSWTPLATVCGSGLAFQTRIAVAAPNEFWTVSDPRREIRGSVDLSPVPVSTLCHFKDGQLLASYATNAGDVDRYDRMYGAACSGPDDCWFVGQALDPPRTGAFRLHWDGTAVRVVSGLDRRDIVGIAAAPDGFREVVERGAGSDPGSPAALIRQIPLGAAGAAAITDDGFVPAPPPNADPQDYALRVVSGDGTRIWAAGGTAQGSPSPFTRGPLLAVRETGGEFRDLPLTDFAPGSTIRLLAAEPGTDRAWAVVGGDPARGLGDPYLAAFDTTGQIVDTSPLPDPDDPDPNARAFGTATALACSGPGDCWLGTDTGWLYHLTGAPQPAQDTASPYARLITDRPADGSSLVFVPDSAPVDDSGADLGFASENDRPPDTSPEPVIEAPKPRATRVKIRALSRAAISVSFRLNRRARVRVSAYHGKKVVSRSPRRTLKKGAHAVTLKVTVARWPTRITLDVVAPK